MTGTKRYLKNLIMAERSDGLTKSQYEELCRIFALHPLVDNVKIYGSRAKGTFTSHSDIDLSISGEKLDRHSLADLLMDLNESDIPYLIDAQDYKEIQNTRLKDHIDRIGKVIYQRNG